MDFLKKYPLLLLFLFILTGCQLGYILKSTSGQISILNSRVANEEILSDPKISEAVKAKIKLSQEAKIFAEKELGLKSTRNYTEYVKLNRPYVSYVVSAAHKWELKHFLWHFPFLGDMPYKGFFDEQDAKEEELSLQSQGYDTYLRGVSAYSSLGWFRDPLLSSMMNYSDHNLVNTIIHETVHATLYIKNSADFNERMAVFVGNLGTEKFYLAKEGADSATVKNIHAENEDEKKFSEFVGKEIKNLEQWYLALKDKDENIRAKRIKQIQENFKTELLPKLKTKSYKNFPEVKLNNAQLMLYKTYTANLADFQKLYDKVNQNIIVFLEQCKSLEKHPDPEKGLRGLL